ncbi:MAG: M15 family metallopeptidase [Syntrophobacteraceae bacterium]|nr:M15 family metallopeptidase [Desulfobacteraceae bacterium]
MPLEKSRTLFLLAFLLLFPFICSPAALGGTLPEGFVYVDDAVPGIKIELRYYTRHNFTGDRVDGYTAPRCILTKEAAEALREVQGDLKRFGLGLKIYDAYRPQQAVDHFVRWAKDLRDIRMKKEFYPRVDKKDLFKEDYIAEKSGHSRGSTVDLTIVPLDPRSPDTILDMGTGFDYFGPESWPDYQRISPARRAHRMLLQLVMERHGFTPYPKEWWHFTLKNEPFPDTYFNFPIR